MYQVIMVTAKSGGLEKAVEVARAFISNGIMTSLMHKPYSEAAKLYKATDVKTMAIHPLHITKSKKPAYYVFVTKLSGHAGIQDGVQVIFAGDEYSEFLDADILGRVINLHARMPADRLNRANREELMGHVLGPMFMIVPPTGLKETFSVSEISRVGVEYGDASDIPTAGIMVVTASTGILNEVTDIYNLIDKAEKKA